VKAVELQPRTERVRFELTKAFTLLVFKTRAINQLDHLSSTLVYTSIAVVSPSSPWSRI
jgi:hypothetical protein